MRSKTNWEKEKKTQKETAEKETVVVITNTKINRVKKKQKKMKYLNTSVLI